MKFNVNGTDYEIPPTWHDEMLIQVLREQIGLVGAKHGCGVGECGTCVVHIDGNAVRSCLVPVASAEGRNVVTIEGLGETSGELHPVQQAWLDERVAQCGYCQAGQIMQAAALLAVDTTPNDEAIASAMRSNLCRCGTYDRIRRAIRRAGKLMRQPKQDRR